MIYTFTAWLIIVFIVSFIILTAFSYILGWWYPEPQIIVELPEEYEANLSRSRRQLAGISILVIIIIIIISTAFQTYISDTNA